MTTHELYQRHAPALGIDSYNTFCKLLELLDAPAVRECQFPESKAWYAADQGTTAQMFRQCLTYDLGLARRVVLLDGTVVREWPTDEYDGIF